MTCTVQECVLTQFKPNLMVKAATLTLILKKP